MKIVLPLLIVSMWAATAAAQQSHVLIVAGLSGDPEHAEVFHKWSSRLVDAAKQRYGVADANVVYLAEDPKVDPGRIDGRASREEITKAFEALARRAAPEDPVLIVLIGHGSSGARFNLPGPDMTAAEFAKLLQPIRSKRLAFVNAASASGSFVAPLAAPGRLVITATRREAEQYATLFGGFFIEALAGDAADMDKDQRVSLLEAFSHARRATEEAYKREGLLATEHAVLDDNGDAEPSPEPGPNAADGQLAASIHLGVGAERAASLPADPGLRALYAERDELEARVSALKLLKASMEPARYARELESLLTALALKSREIRDLEHKP
jgi:hypothetical protein